MINLNNKKEIEEKIFKEVIELKEKISISSSQICDDLNIDEEVLSDYFLGTKKQNLPLGIYILNYLEEREISNKNTDTALKNE